MGVIAWIVLGLGAGLLANMLILGRRSQGLIITCLIGDTARGREVDDITAALADAGQLERQRPARLVHVGLWGPGRFSPALREAVAQGKVQRTGRGLYALAPGAPDLGDDSRPGANACQDAAIGYPAVR